MDAVHEKIGRVRGWGSAERDGCPDASGFADKENYKSVKLAMFFQVRSNALLNATSSTPMKGHITIFLVQPMFGVLEMTA